MTTISLQFGLSVFGAMVAAFGLGFLLGRIFEMSIWWRNGWRKE